MGLLINNYQSAVGEFGGSAGQYQNTFGIAIASLGPGGTNGRAFGYQTGLYLSDCSYEAIRIRGGVYGSSSQYTRYGIKFEGTRCSVAGIDLGDNLFNWSQYYGSSWVNGSMWANTSSGRHVLYFRSNNTNGEVAVLTGAGTSGSYTADRKLAVYFNGQTYYLLASTSA